MTSRCPRCGSPIPPPAGRGRPPKWCSDNCRRRAHEDRRAARPHHVPVEVREVVRERVADRIVYVPHNPITAVDLVLSDTDAVELLLRRVIAAVSTAPETDLDRARLRALHLKLTARVTELQRALTAQPQQAPASHRELTALTAATMGHQARPKKAKGKAKKRRRH